MKTTRTDSIARLKNRVLECGGEVFFGDIALEEGEGYVGNSEMPVVSACIDSETVWVKIRAVKVNEKGSLHIIAEYSSGGIGEDEDEGGGALDWKAGEIIDPLDVNDIYDNGIDEITNDIKDEEKTVWLRLGVTWKGSKKEIETILENGTGATDTLWHLLDNNRFEINGETYIPATVVEEYNKENNTDFEAKDIDFAL